MDLKFDMSKAYDRVEWGYLRVVLSKLGFNEIVVNLFVQCVTSTRYRITHSGRKFENIVPGRGLRQGDPLSSYLFLIYSDGFTTIMKHYEDRELLKGIHVARGAPSASHMLFTDDSYIFCKVSCDEASCIVNLLDMFEKVSGQKINMEKSSVFFSWNVEVNSKQEICELLHFAEADENSHYLGLSNFIGRKKSAKLRYIKEKVQSRMQSWDEKILTKVGKEILLKTVTQAIPNYVMRVFL